MKIEFSAENNPCPLLFLSGKPDEKGLYDLLKQCAECGYGGVGVISYKATEIPYLSEEYFEMYGILLKVAKSLGLKVCLYDEYWFPSGKAGGLLAEKFPEAVTSKLNMVRDSLSAGGFVLSRQDGVLKSAVAFNEVCDERRDVTELCADGAEFLPWNEKGEWSLLRFFCVHDHHSLVNYLEPESVNRFIELTHEAFYRHFPEYFGDTINSAFYDEPQFYSQHGRTWTVNFNREFEARKGYSPHLLYPALFMDIGDSTASARCEMLSVRADLYAEGFPGTIQKWCTAHGIALKGHIDQEEVVNPGGITDDVLKSFRYQDVPGIDQICFPGRARRAYKLVSSAAYNWNKQRIMCECFGATNGLTEAQMYRETQDLFVKGINEIIPHAVWYDDRKVVFEPELSPRHPYYGSILPRYNAFVNRLTASMKDGVHVGQVAVLYPVEGLHSQVKFITDDTLTIDCYYAGGPSSRQNDYLELGEYLTYSCALDYTFLHPERLKDNILIAGGTLSLTSSLHDEKYHVILLSGQDTISLAVLRTLQAFVQSGGTLISTSMLPRHSSEPGEDDAVKTLVRDLFGTNDIPFQKIHKAVGMGHCYALPVGDYEEMRDILFAAGVLPLACSVEGIATAHRRRENTDIWYIVNQNGADIDLKLRLPTEKPLKLYNPYTDAETDLPSFHTNGFSHLTQTIPSGESLLILAE